MKNKLGHEWLTLEQSADYLSIQLGEKYTKTGVIQLVLDEKITCSAILQHCPAEEVAFQTKLGLGIFDRKTNSEKLKNIETIDVISPIPRTEAPCGLPNHYPDCWLTGVFDIDLSINRGIELYLLEELAGSEVKQTAKKWIVVKHSTDKSMFRLLDQFDEEERINLLSLTNDNDLRLETKQELKQRFQQFISSHMPSKYDAILKFDELITKEKTVDSLVWMSELYIPTVKPPSISKIVIRSSELEKLAKDSTQIGKTAQNNMYRMIGTLIHALIGEKPQQNETDSRACLAALEAKGITSPVKAKTIQNYLREYNNLSPK